MKEGEGKVKRCRGGKEGKRAGRGWREKGSFGKVEDMDFATDCKDPRER